MKVLFLDIDGVLNSFDNSKVADALWHCNPDNKSKDQFGTLFDERCVRWLSWIIFNTSCSIVMSSTWRLSGLEAVQTMWSERNLPGEIIDITPLYASRHTLNLYAEEAAFAERGYEVQEWLDNNEVEQYCIVDDNNDMFLTQNFVQTDGQVGLTHQSARDIVRILNNQSLVN